MAIYFDENRKIFKLNTKNSSYVIKVYEGGYLLHLHFGKKLTDTNLDFLIPHTVDSEFAPRSQSVKGDLNFSTDIKPMEYSVNGTGDYRISALQIRGADGTAATDIRYKSHRIYSGKYFLPGLPATYAAEDEADTLEIVTEDVHTGAEVTLLYGVFKNYDAITRAVKIENKGSETFDIERVYSTCVSFHRMDMDMIGLWGSWGRERTPARCPLEHGIREIKSKRGSSSHYHNPFACLCEHHTTEQYGEVYGFSFVYSGNFSAQTEVDAYGQSRIIMGLEDTDFGWHMECNEVFYTPEVVMVYSDEGLGGMSRIYHKLYRNHLCRGAYKTAKRPLLINNWEATYMNFNGDKLLQIAKEAAELGVDMFVLDDGWFGERNTDKSSLGDWYVNEKKLGRTLKELVDEINNLDLKFGLWFEPEMISPDSELYRKHPDWCIHISGRESSLGRNQLVLDMSREDVRDYLMQMISKIMDSANIEYIKWDFNRNLTEVGSDVLAVNRQKELFHRYILGLYDLLEKLLQKYPKILLEGCSGGGGRFDPGMLYYAPQIWTSDDSDAIERIRIQYGTSFVYPASAISAHVSAVPNHQTQRHSAFETRGNVALTGAFGYELDVSKVSEEEKALVREQISNYHKYYDVIHNGNQYRIVSPFENEHYAAWEYVSDDKKEVLFTFAVMRGFFSTTVQIRLPALNPEFVYVDQETGEEYSGSALMYAGLHMAGESFTCDGYSKVIYLEAKQKEK